MEDLSARFVKTTGHGLLGDLTQMLLDSDRLEQYDRTRVIEAVEAAPEYFYRIFVQPMLDGMANDLARGFDEVDLEG